MVKSPAKIIGYPQRLLQAAALALLWGLDALLGASGLSASVFAPTTPPPACAVKAAASALVCHCKMCRGIMRGGKMVCCCGNSHVPETRAVITARCDQGAPAALATMTSWPVVQPGLTAALLVCLSGRRFTRPGDTLSVSLSHLPLTPPPSFL